MQADTGVLEDIGRGEGDDDSGIGKEAVAQENLAEPAELISNGKRAAVVSARRGQGDGRNLAAGELYERAAEEVAEADAKGGHRKTCDVLVCAQ